MGAFWRKWWRRNTPPLTTTPRETPSHDWDAARADMITTQLRARGIGDGRLLAVMARLPRHSFLPTDAQDRAYEDHPAPIGCAQTISQPYMVAVMTEMLALRPTDRVLEIGTGSGYQSAILAALAREVFSVERHAVLAAAARARLQALDIANVTVIVGDGSLGHADAAPYDAILVTAGAPTIPEPLKDQLAVGGRLICPVGNRDLQRLSHITRRSDTEFTEENGMQCIFVPLLGEAGWREGDH